MKRTVHVLVIGLTLTAGSVLALEETATGSSDRVISKLLALTDSLQERVAELEKTVDEQKAEIARLNLQKNRVPTQTVPPFVFTPNAPRPNQPKIWQHRVDPLSPVPPMDLPPGTVSREINGMRFYIVPCKPETTFAPAAIPPTPSPGSVTRVPIRTTVPPAR